MAATVEGVFRIIDRASPAMRGMERQAIKTDVAISKLGASLDTVGGRKQLNQIENATRDTRTLGNEAGNAEKKVGRASNAFDSMSRNTGKLRRETAGLGVAFRDLGKFMKPVLFLGIGSAIGIVVQGVGNLVGGLTALTPRLADMVGLLAPAGAGITALGLTVGTAMLAFSGLSKAMGGNKAALKALTPEARGFLTQLKAYAPVLKQLRRDAQGGGLFGGLEYALARLQRAEPTVSRLVRMMSGRIGAQARNAADRLTSSSSLSDINSLGDQGGRVFTRGSQSIMDLVSALRHFSVAAIPFTDWMTKAIEGWAKQRAAVAQFNRDSGKTAAFLDRTKVALTGVVHIGENLWETFRRIGQAARPLGDNLWVSMERATKGWANTLGDPSKRVALTRDFLAMGAAFHEIVGLAGDLGKAIFNMGAQGQLGGTVQSLRGLVPSLEKVLNLLANDLGPPLAKTLTAAGNLLAATGGILGPLTMTLHIVADVMGVLSQMATLVPGLGHAMGAAFSVILISRFLTKLGLLEAGWWRVTRAAQAAAVATAEASGAGFGGAAAMGPLAYGFKSGRAGGRLSGFGAAASVGSMLGRGRTGAALVRGGAMLSRAGRIATPLGIGLAAAGLGAQFLPVGNNVKSVGMSALTGAGLGAMIGSAVPVLGTAVGAGVGGVLGAGYGLMKNAGGDGGAGAANSVTAKMNAQLASVESYPIAIGRMTAQLGYYHDAYRQLQQQGTAAAQAEMQQLRMEIQARSTVVAQLRAEARQRSAAAAMGRVRAISGDLGNLFDLMTGAGSTKGMAADVVNRDALGELKKTKDPKARFALASGLLSWEQGVLGKKSPIVSALASTLQNLVPGLVHRGTPGYQAQGTPQSIQGVLNQMGYAEAFRQRRRQAPTALQGALIAELVAGGIDGASARAMVMSSDGIGRPNINAQNVTPGSKALSKLGNPAGVTPASVNAAIKARERLLVQTYKDMMDGKASGGRIRGSGLGDTVPVAPGSMAAPGELIVNRHQEAAADRMLGGKGALGSIVSGIHRPHWAPFAAGGRVGGGGLQGHILGVMNSVLGKFPGLSVTSTTGGTHAKNSYHYLGEAVDLGGSPGVMNKAASWIMRSGLYRQLAEGIHNPNLSVKNGKLQSALFWGAKTWAGHRDHLHLAALGGGMTPFTGAGAGAGAGVNTLGKGAVNIGGVYGHQALAQAAARSIMGLRTFGSIRSGGGGTSTSSAAMPSSGSAPTGNRALGRSMMLAHGWSGSEWPSLDQLWTGESGWNATATNKSSGAFGIPQALPASKMGPKAVAGDPGAQIGWGLDYISGRYGSPSSALSAWNARNPHWYSGGGRLRYAGAFAAGGRFRTNGPTAFIAGEGSNPHETVTVDNGRGGRASGLHIGSLTIIHDRPGDIRDQVLREIRAAWATFADELAHTSPAGGG